MKKMAMVACLITGFALSAAAVASPFSVGIRGGWVQASTHMSGETLIEGEGGASPEKTLHDGGAMVGPYVRYLHHYKRLLLGLDASYEYLDSSTTATRLVNGNTGAATETFNSKVNGLVELDPMLGVRLTNKLSLLVFGGPAWINTQYTEDDLVDGVIRKSSKRYQLTANVGGELDWQATTHFVVGVRGDYIFQTPSSIISSTSADGGEPLANPITASSKMVAAELSVGYEF